MFAINTSRVGSGIFDIEDFVEFNSEEKVYDSADALLFDNLRFLPQKGEFEVGGEELRLDLISYRLYGTVAYWWILFYYNDLDSFEDVRAGLKLKYPDLGSLEEFYFQLRNLA